MAKQAKYEIREGRTEIDFPHRDGKITVLHPPFGPSNYQSVGKQILENNLVIPTAEQTVTLLHAAYLGPEEFREKPQIKEIRNLMKKGWFFGFQPKPMDRQRSLCRT